MNLAKMKSLLKVKSLQDISGLWLSQLLAAFSAFLTQFLLVRILSVEQYGSFSTAITLTGIIASLAGFGVGSYWLRVFGKEGLTGFRWVKNTLKLALGSIVLSLLVLFFVAFVSDVAKVTKILLLFFSTIILSQGLATLAYSIYQLEGNYKKLSFFQFLTHGLRLVAVLIVIALDGTLIQVGIGYVLSSLLLAIFYTKTIFRLRKGKVNFKDQIQTDTPVSGDIPTLSIVFKNSWPYSLSGVFYLLYFQSNVFLLSVLVGEEASGVYNVALTVLTVVYLFPSAIYQGFLLPKIHRWAVHDKKKITAIFQSGGKIILLFGILLMILLSSTAIWVIPVLFGEEYIISAYILVIVSVSIPIRLLGNNLASILVTENNMVKKVYYQGLGAVLNIVLNLIFIPKYGVYGAAYTTIFTEIFVTLMFIHGVKSYVPGIRKIEIHNKYKYLSISLVCMTIPIIYLTSMIYYNSSIINSLLLFVSLSGLFFILIKTFINERGLPVILQSKA